MHVLCTQENLWHGLSAVSHIAGKNTNLPILNNVLIKTEEGGVRLLSTNLEIGISCLIRGKVEEPGEFTLPARVLGEYVSLLPKENVHISIADGQATIKGGNNETKIKGEEASEFPTIPTIEKTNPLAVNVSDLSQAISQVIFSTSMSETRPEISGVLFTYNPETKQLILAATDSYRLAERKINVSAGGAEAKRIIIPAKTLQEVLRILSNAKKTSDEAGLVQIYSTDNQILFVYDNIELISRVIEGQYPEYQQIIPSSHGTQAIVGVDDLVRATKSASLFVKSGINDVSLELKPESEIIVSSLNAQVGESTQVITANISGSQNALVLNYRYFLDGLQAINTPEVVIEATDNNTPVILKPVLPSADEGIDKNYLYLIMPIKQ